MTVATSPAALARGQTDDPGDLEGLSVLKLVPIGKSSTGKGGFTAAPTADWQTLYTYLQGGVIMCNYSITQTHYEYLEHHFPSS